jgi:glycosyltransferase involved in cell wall biosynthesis
VTDDELPQGSVLRLALVADGHPELASTNSGVALGILTALRRRADVRVPVLVDSTPQGPWRLVNAVATCRPRRTAWRNEFRKGRLSTWLRTRKRDRALRAFHGHLDVVLHVRNTYHPCCLPYASFVDGTAHLSQLGWPAWQLSRRSFAHRVRDERAQFDAAVAVYTAAEHVAADVIAFYGQPVGKVRAVGGGLNFAPEQEVIGRPSHRRVLFVGIDFARKGGPVLLEAFREVRRIFPDASLTVVGPDDRPGISGTEEWLTFVGRVKDRSALRQLYRDADIFCVPSLFEPYGLVVQEAMVHGLTCVVSDVQAMPELVDFGRSGIVTRHGDAGDLAAGLVKVMSDPELSNQMARRSAAKVETMTWDAVAERLVPHLREAAQGLASCGDRGA